MTVLCPACGKENQDSAEVCFACGARLPREGPESLVGRTVFGAYELEELIGEGGMAVVYKARHQLTGQLVAVKMLPPELAVYPEVRARFVDEARTLARLEHPNIVHLINFAEEMGRLCLVMQYAEGQTLEEILDTKGRISGQDAVRIAREVLAALGHAHSQGVVHRDIKPSNIIVRPDGTVKVTDFGIAKIARDTKLTQTGQTMGTVRYMSPEQVRGAEIDGRSDIYSLGVTLYECVVGRTPFEGDTHFAIMSQHLSADPTPPIEAGARISKALEDVILKALAKDPLDRYQTAEEMARALEATPEARATQDRAKALQKSARVASGGRPKGRRKVFLALGGLAAAVLLGVGVVLWGPWQRSEEASPPRAGDVARPRPRSRPSVAELEVRRWKKLMEPHLARLNQKIEWAVQTERNVPPYLRIWSDVPVDTALVERIYLDAIPIYRRLLQAEHIRDKLVPRPLVIVFLSHKAFVDQAIWGSGAEEVEVRYYPLPVATLYVPIEKKLNRSALLYGIGGHLCPARLPASQCDALAERLAREFERAAGTK